MITAKEKAHRTWSEQREQFESAVPRGSHKQALEEQMCAELVVQAQQEREDFAPVVRKALPRRQRRCWQ